MTTPTLDRVLADAGKLPAEDREMLEWILHQRRIEAWRIETAAEAKKAVSAFRSGKVKSQSIQKVISQLRAAD